LNRVGVATSWRHPFDAHVILRASSELGGVLSRESILDLEHLTFETADLCCLDRAHDVRSEIAPDTATELE